jgi:hypothetical protein
MDSTMSASDGLPDDRVSCGTCLAFQRPGYCRALSMSTCRTTPLRCSRYSPIRSEPDQRNGEARWPNLAAIVAEVRALDLARNAA